LAKAEVLSKKVEELFYQDFRGLNEKNFCLLPSDFLLEFRLEAGATFAGAFCAISLHSTSSF